MTRYRIMSHDALKEEMKAVARGERKAPADAAHPNFNSIEAMTRLLTSENRHLLAVIRDEKPRSIAELADLTGRAAPNLTRTLTKLEAAGLIKMTTVNRRKVPTALVKTLRVKIDPYSDRDVLEIA
jgi:predicted transcriptional regulator